MTAHTVWQTAAAAVSGHAGGNFRPSVSVGVPTVLPGLDEALYREAEARKQRQLMREEEAWLLQQQQSRPRLSRNSRALCQARLERELHAAFQQCLQRENLSLAGEGQVEVIPRSCLQFVLETMDFLSGAEEDEVFCSKLALLLDQDDTGLVRFDSLLSFISNSLDSVDRHVPRSHAVCTLEEECFNHLELQLSKTFGRMLSNRLSRPKLDASARCRHAGSSSRAASQEPPASPGSGQGAAARTPSPPRPERHGAPRRDLSSTPASRQPSRPQSAGLREDRFPRSRTEGSGLDRCHLLYHQAIFAAREGAQLEEEIKLLKEREEMRECTFRPKLLPARRPSSQASPRPLVRNFDATVARMKAAHKQQMAREKERQHIPCGENYERLRRLGNQPFSCAFRDRKPHRRQPLLYVDVNVGHGRTGRIGVHEGDDLRVLAKNFARTFQLDASALDRLENLLHEAYSDHVQGKDEPAEGYAAEK
eukprot:TRINITY_DN13342_c0_g1_i1.p1 TRINITY_DN13342_c0_g1~~TRINITY_DN13342_c0_g1_i1.p1  ORF type:complete len:495 (+),score=93.24 TRINITY_DN13342_c0_g1_i1:50-1486(+)